MLKLKGCILLYLKDELNFSPSNVIMQSIDDLEYDENADTETDVSNIASETNGTEV